MLASGGHIQNHNEQVAASGGHIQNHNEQVVASGGHIQNHNEQVAASGGHIQNRTEQVPASGGHIQNHNEQLAAHCDRRFKRHTVPEIRTGCLVTNRSSITEMYGIKRDCMLLKFLFTL